MILKEATVQEPLSMRELLRAYRESHASKMNFHRAHDLGATCVKDDIGDTRCGLCKRFDEAFGGQL